MNICSPKSLGKREALYFFYANRQKWLKKVGSPASRIDRALFTHTKEIESYESESFIVKK